jgi:hypothetical protein
VKPPCLNYLDNMLDSSSDEKELREPQQQEPIQSFNLYA